jgi:hypothetical protein
MTLSVLAVFGVIFLLALSVVPPKQVAVVTVPVAISAIAN